MKCLIFGGNGFLGSRLLNKLSPKYEIFSSSRNSVFFSNFGDGKSVNRVIQEIKPKLIINCSAFADVNGCESDPNKAFKINALGVKEISESINIIDKSIRFIHISTDHFYDSSEMSPEDKVLPKNIYAYSKLLGEKYIVNDNALILRTNFFGKSLTSKKSFSDWLFENLSAGKSIDLYDDIFFNPLSIASIESLIFRLINSSNKGIFNLGSSSFLSKHDFGLKFCIDAGLDASNIRKVSSAINNNYNNRPKSMTMSIKKFQAKFDIILPSLEEEITKSVKEYI